MVGSGTGCSYKGDRRNNQSFLKSCVISPPPTLAFLFPFTFHLSPSRDFRFSCFSRFHVTLASHATCTRFSCNLHALLALCLSWVNIPEHSSSSSSGPHGSSSSGSLFITLLMASCWAIVRLSLLTELMACTWGACIALYWSAEKDWGEDNVVS